MRSQVMAKRREINPMDTLLREYADYICTHLEDCYFPRESPLYRLMREGVSNKTAPARRKQVETITVDVNGVLEERVITYWRNIWASNCQQRRHVQGRVLNLSRSQDIPIEYEAINQIMFDCPSLIYSTIFIKYFLTSFSGKKLTDKLRCKILGMDKDKFYHTLEFCQLWVEFNLPKKKERLRNHRDWRLYV